MGGVVLTAIIFSIVVVLVLLAVPAVAASPLFPECPQVATAGGIKIYYCDDTIVDTPFYVNQLGWMMPEPQ